MAIENPIFLHDLPIKTSIDRGFISHVWYLYLVGGFNPNMNHLGILRSLDQIFFGGNSLILRCQVPSQSIDLGKSSYFTNRKNSSASYGKSISLATIFFQAEVEKRRPGRDQIYPLVN